VGSVLSDQRMDGSNNNVGANGLITYEEVVSKKTFARIIKITPRTLVFC
jgi:hypothetical protein